MDHLRIRSAGAADLPALLGLYQHLAPDEAPSPDAAETILQRFQAYPGSAIFLGEAAGHPVATCTLVVIPNLTRGGAPYGLIENVVTHADHRGRGHGKRLLDAAVEAAWAEGCYKVMLMTGSTAPATLGFYKAAGFEQSKTGFQKRRRPARVED